MDLLSAGLGLGAGAVGMLFAGLMIILAFVGDWLGQYIKGDVGQYFKLSERLRIGIGLVGLLFLIVSLGVVGYTTERSRAVLKLLADVEANTAVLKGLSESFSLVSISNGERIDGMEGELSRFIISRTERDAHVDGRFADFNGDIQVLRKDMESGFNEQEAVLDSH